MDEPKSIKIRPELHKKLTERADLLGMKIGRFCEALLSAGLTLSNDAILDELKIISENNKDCKVETNKAQ